MSKPPLLHVLDPLGGEDNLTLMCGVEKFTYILDNRVEFSLSDLKVHCTTDWDYLSREQYWGISIRKKLSGHVIHYSSYITGFRLVGRVFETYTDYRLWF